MLRIIIPMIVAVVLSIVIYSYVLGSLVSVGVPAILAGILAVGAAFGTVAVGVKVSISGA